MTSPTDYQNFVKGLNYGHHGDVMTEPELVMHLSFDSRVMSPSQAKSTVASLVSEGAISRKGNYIDLRNLYDPSKKMYVMKSGKTGRTLKVRRPVTSARTVRYVKPGLTEVGYAHRTLSIRFKETQKEFDAKKHLRRVHAAKKGAKKRSESTLPIFVDRDDSSMMVFVTKSGKDATSSAKRKSDKGKAQIIKRKLSRDAYTVEDMRAILKDDHWEEISGNKRWMTDSKETVKQFNNYLKRKNRR